MALAIWFIVKDAPNWTGFYTYVTLWGMHLSARTADRWFVSRFGSKANYFMAYEHGTLGGKLAISSDDVRAFGTFDASKYDVSDDDDRSDDQDDSHRKKKTKRPRIIDKF